VSRIESFFLEGPAGRLECMLKVPSPGSEGAGAAVICHPHPLFGGTLHNKVVHATAEALVLAGLPTLRFNFRGTGGSGGAHDGGRGEQDDLITMIDHLEARYPGRPLVLAGYSFGAYVMLQAACRDGRGAALIGIGLPLTMMPFDFLAGCARPLTIIQGDRDLFGPLPLVMARAATLPQGARVVAVPGAAHNFAGRLEELALRVGEAIPARLVGGRAE
jgi:alpha/beta superfamily hydrolase